MPVQRLNFLVALTLEAPSTVAEVFPSRLLMGGFIPQMALMFHGAGRHFGVFSACSYPLPTPKNVVPIMAEF